MGQGHPLGQGPGPARHLRLTPVGPVAHAAGAAEGDCRRAACEPRRPPARVGGHSTTPDRAPELSPGACGGRFWSAPAARLRPVGPPHGRPAARHASPSVSRESREHRLRPADRRRRDRRARGRPCRGRGALDRRQRPRRRHLRRLVDPGPRGSRRRPQAPGHVHRLHRRARPAPPGLRGRRQRRRRGPGRLLRPHRRHAPRRRRRPGRRQRPWHPGRRGRRRGPPGRRGRADRAARRRQVRRRRLHGVRRPARRRRLRRQRAVAAARGRGPPRRLRLDASPTTGRPPGRPAGQGRRDRRDRHDDHLLGRRRHLRDDRLRLRDARRAASRRWPSSTRACASP